MNPTDIPKTAIFTPFGLFKFSFMPFGFKNAAQTFQCLMDSLFCDCPFVFIYLDDILTFSKDKAEHFKHLNMVFQILADSGLHLNPAKCTCAAFEIDCLGHRVTPSGLAPLSSCVQPIRNFPLPSDVKGLQCFLGMLNFYRCFLASSNPSLMFAKVLVLSSGPRTCKLLSRLPNLPSRLLFLSSILSPQPPYPLPRMHPTRM